MTPLRGGPGRLLYKWLGSASPDHGLRGVPHHLQRGGAAPALRSYYNKPQDCVALRVVRSVDAIECLHVRGTALGKPGSVRQ
eukprot:212001-Heterocapsa_arctica.AAC.1